MNDKIMQKLENIKIAAAYAVSAALTTTPKWVGTITNYLELVAVMIGIAAGITTIIYNVKRIFKK